MLSIKQILQYSILEDSFYGDLTSEILQISGNGKFVAISKEDAIICGLKIFQKIFKLINSSIEVKLFFKDGNFVKSGEIIAEIKGNLRDILKGERIALNFIQKLSGISTNTYYFVKQIEGTNCKILDTRKTTPLLRKLEKYAVRIGGGYNHRFSLFDGILIKDNHIRAVGGIENAIKLALKNKPIGKEIEVEVSSLEELEIAIKYPINIVMLDNFNIDMIKQALSLINNRLKVEVSGGVNLNNVRDIALLGVDYISVGALTHSSRWIDISLELIK
ncbi:MAG: carboxylating nicotinate-nucleotide diphosphorylase [candidate division WOR-3 bacterium]